MRSNLSDQAQLAGEGLNSFVASDWKPREKNTLRGFCSISMPSGLKLHECALHEKDGSRWVGLPARSYEKDGETKWARLMDFDSKKASQQFQTLALKAIDELLQNGGGK